MKIQGEKNGVYLTAYPQSQMAWTQDKHSPFCLFQDLQHTNAEHCQVSLYSEANGQNSHTITLGCIPPHWLQ